MNAVNVNQKDAEDTNVHYTRATHAKRGREWEKGDENTKDKENTKEILDRIKRSRRIAEKDGTDGVLVNL